MTDRGKILVLGAGGVLGRLIVALLREDHPGLEVIAASRHDPGDLPVAHRLLDLAEPDTFPEALTGIDVLIHAAGPFHHDPAPLVRACLARGVHYVDIAEDAHFIARVEAAARAWRGARSTVMPGCSTVPGLVAVLSQVFGRLPALSSVAVFLNLGSRNPVSAGLLSGLLAPLGRPLQGGGRCFRRLVRRRHRDAVTRCYGAYPIPFPDGLPLGGRAVPVSFFTGFDRCYLNAGLKCASFVLPALGEGPPARLVRLLLPVARLCRRFGGEEGHLVVEARGGGGELLAEVEVIARKEGLRLPAAPAVWAAARLVRSGADGAAGLLPLQSLVDARAAVQWIRDHGYEVHDR